MLQRRFDITITLLLRHASAEVTQITKLSGNNSVTVVLDSPGMIYVPFRWGWHIHLWSNSLSPGKSNGKEYKHKSHGSSYEGKYDNVILVLVFFGKITTLKYAECMKVAYLCRWIKRLWTHMLELSWDYLYFEHLVLYI